jgi:hypothetical protein
MKVFSFYLIVRKILHQSDFLLKINGILAEKVPKKQMSFSRFFLTRNVESILL